jgi:hypothetical protein
MYVIWIYIPCKGSQSRSNMRSKVTAMSMIPLYMSQRCQWHSCACQNCRAKAKNCRKNFTVQTFSQDRGLVKNERVKNHFKKFLKLNMKFMKLGLRTAPLLAADWPFSRVFRNLFGALLLYTLNCPNCRLFSNIFHCWTSQTLRNILQSSKCHFISWDYPFKGFIQINKFYAIN